MKSKPISGTLAETYLREERGIKGLLADDLRYLPKETTFIYQGVRKTIAYPCLAAFGRSSNGRLSSVQLTKLTKEGRRALTPDGQKLAKIHYGIAKGSFVCLQEDKTADRVFIAEGVETALSLKGAGIKGRIVASLGIHNIATYQGPEKDIILCGDNDNHKPNSQTHTILEKAQESFKAQGKDVLLIKPSQPGDDFNDVLKKQGIQGVQEHVKPYLDPNKQIETPSPLAFTETTVGKQRVVEGTKYNSLDLISDYLNLKLKEMKAFEGTSLGEEAKNELREYMKTLQKNETLFNPLQEQHKDLAKELEHLSKEKEQTYARDKCRGLEM